MPPVEPFLIFTRKLNELGLAYMVSGSVAAIFYGEPRLTNDIDIILILKQEDVHAFAASFPLDEFYCPPAGVLHVEIARKQRGHFNLIHHATGFKADIYTGGRDALHDWGFAHTRQIDFDGEKLILAPPEYVIVRKLQFFREGKSPKHLRDIERMLLGLGTTWPREALLSLLAEHGLSAEWQAVLECAD